MSTFITAFEVGSSKIKGAVGIVGEDKSLDVVAIEEMPLTAGSVRHGCAVNVEEISSRINHIKQLLENNTQIVPRKIKRCYVALGGRSLCSYPVETTRSFTTETEITDSILTEMKKQIREKGTDNKEILDVVPVSYNIDGKNVATPAGTIGSQIRVRYNLVACDAKNTKNLSRAFEKSKLKIIGGISRILAIESLVMTKDQKGLGSVLIDMGAETTTIAVYKENSLRYLVTIPMGSRLITQDLATLLNISEERAEELKRNYVNLTKKSDEEESSYVEKTLDNLDYRTINNIARARASEIISNIEYQINQSRLKPEELTEGIVVIGKGARLNGFKELLQSHLHMKVSQPAITENIHFAYNLNVPASESLEIVAILAAAARSARLGDCTELPKTGGIEIDETPAKTPEPEKVKEEKKPEVKKEKRKGIGKKIADGLIGFIRPEDPDFDDEE